MRVAWSADGALLASGLLGRGVHAVRAMGRMMCCMACKAAYTAVALPFSGSADNTVRVWRVPDAAALRQEGSYSGACIGLPLSPVFTPPLLNLDLAPLSHTVSAPAAALWQVASLLHDPLEPMSAHSLMSSPMKIIPQPLLSRPRPLFLACRL